MTKIYSMTAFTRNEADSPLGRVTWELRSVNHRFLDISLKLPEEFRQLEPQLRSCIQNHLNRGKIDGALKFDVSTNYSQSHAPRLNQVLAKQIIDLAKELSALSPESNPPDIAAMLRWPGIVQEADQDLTPLHQTAIDGLNQALQAMTSTRLTEGHKLASNIKDRLTSIKSYVDQIEQRLPSIREHLESKLHEKINKISQDLDQNRLHQEIAYLAQKADIKEELDRLTAHLSEFDRVLTLTEPVGRRLDFLCQELHREVNTIGSKSIDKTSSQITIDLKVLIEQIREQVQNIE